MRNLDEFVAFARELLVDPTVTQGVSRAFVSHAFFFSPARRFLVEEVLPSQAFSYGVREEVLFELVSPTYAVRESVRNWIRRNLPEILEQEMRASAADRLQTRFTGILLYAMVRFSCFPTERSEILNMLVLACRHRWVLPAFLYYYKNAARRDTELITDALDWLRSRLADAPTSQEEMDLREVEREILSLQEERLNRFASSCQPDSGFLDQMLIEFIEEHRGSPVGIALYGDACGLVRKVFSVRGRPVDFCYFLTVEEGRCDIRAWDAVDGISPSPLPAEIDIAAEVFQKAQPKIWSGEGQGELPEGRRLFFPCARSLLAVPWLVGSRVRGVIAMGRTDASVAFDATDVGTVAKSLRYLRPILDEAHRDRMSERELVSVSRLKTLTRGFAHELYNPLENMKADLSTIRRSLDDPSVLSECVESLENQRKRMLAVLKDFREVREWTGTAKVPIALPALFDEATQQLLRTEADKRTVSLQFDIQAPADGCTIYGNREALQTVLINLVRNAAEASQPEQAVEVRAIRGKNDVYVQVIDRGTGIPGDLMDKLFTPLFSTKRSDRPRGYGLYLAHVIVSDHGGRIEVTSEEGKGTTVSVQLLLLQERRE